MEIISSKDTAAESAAAPRLAIDEETPPLKHFSAPKISRHDLIYPAGIEDHAEEKE